MKQFMKPACIFIAALLFVSTEKCNGSALKNLDEDYKRAEELKRPAFSGEKFLPARRQRSTDALLAGMTFRNSSFQALGLEIQKGFQKFDKNGDGHITVEELQEARKKSEEEQSADHAKDMIKDVDRNGNGMVEYAEFEDYMASQIRNPITEEDTEMIAEADVNSDLQVSDKEVAQMVEKEGA